MPYGVEKNKEKKEKMKINGFNYDFIFFCGFWVGIVKE